MSALDQNVDTHLPFRRVAWLLLTPKPLTHAARASKNSSTASQVSVQLSSTTTKFTSAQPRKTVASGWCEQKKLYTLEYGCLMVPEILSLWTNVDVSCCFLKKERYQCKMLTYQEVSKSLRGFRCLRSTAVKAPSSAHPSGKAYLSKAAQKLHNLFGRFSEARNERRSTLVHTC